MTADANDEERLTAYIQRALAGDRDAEDEVISQLLPTLRQRARAIRRGERHAPETDALVATAVRRALRRGTPPPINDTEHFVNLLGRQMRFAVVDEARRVQAQAPLTSVDDKPIAVTSDTPFVMTGRARAVIDRFKALDPERFAIVWQRDVEEEDWDAIGERLGITGPQARYRYKTAIAWLRSEMDGSPEGPGGGSPLPG